MISSLRGVLVEKQSPYLIIETPGGVSYELQASLTTCCRLPDVGETITLYTHFVVREDAHLLFGFYTQAERTLFRTLIKVNGIGPKVALTILSSIEPDGFVRCVMEQDSASLIRLPGIGRKTAERLLIEMKDRFEEWEMNSVMSSTMTKSSANNEALNALMALGYKPQEAARALSQIKQEGLSTEELIRFALKGMVTC